MAEKTQAERRAELLARRQAEAAQARSGDLIGDEPEPEPEEDKDETLHPVYEQPQPVIDEWLERRKFLLSLIRDPELRAEITDDELRAMDARITKKARDERRKAALELLEQDLLHRARVEENLLNANTLRSMEERARLNAKVRVRFDLPDEGQGSNRFRVDGQIFPINQWITMTVAEMESLREIHYRMHVNDIQFRTLDQAGRAGLGINPNNRAQGTTAARILMARSPAIMQVEPILE